MFKSFDSIFNLQVKTELKKDLNNTLYQYKQEGKDGVTKAYDLLQEKVQYYSITVVYLYLCKDFVFKWTIAESRTEF